MKLAIIAAALASAALLATPVHAQSDVAKRAQKKQEDQKKGAKGKPVLESKKSAEKRAAQKKADAAKKSPDAAKQNPGAAKKKPVLDQKG